MNSRLGEIRENKFGTHMMIIRYGSSSDIDIEFLDEHHYVKKHTTYLNFKRGNIKNPFDRTIYNKGYVGVGNYKTRINGKDTIPYIVWKNMMNRCYSEHDSYRSKTYYLSAEVCEEWCNFQTFAQWYENHKYECEGRLHLDKDILYPGNKTYSPYHCLLVPQRINMLFCNKTNHRGLPNGIYKEGNLYYARYNLKELGHCKTIEEAYDLYVRYKKAEIIKVAEEYKNIIPQKVYDALLNYDIRIENDKNFETIK